MLKIIKSISKTNRTFSLLILAITFLGIWFRLYHNDFGLPHSYHADEPEFVEYAVSYTYNLKTIIAEKSYYKLIPVSFVYGTFPTYVFTFLTMIYSKVNGVLGIPFDKGDIYLFLRSIVGVISFFIAPLVSFLYFKLFKDKLGALLTFLLIALNWKLIVLGHYVNADIIITLLLNASFITLYQVYKNPYSKKWIILTGILYGLAAGTKITILITLPLYLYVFWKKDKLFGFTAFLFATLGAFLITNPFSLAFMDRFSFRVFTLATKEAALVFDSVDTSLTKYFHGLSFMLTLPVFILAIYGQIKTKKTPFHIFLIGTIILYFGFYSIQARRVDRWLLPILPILLMYAAYAIRLLKSKILFPLVLGFYLYFPILLLTQFQTNTPRTQAFEWLKTEVPASSNKLGYTEEGLDPLHRVPGMDMRRMGTYSSENAQFILPENPIGYDYIVVATKPMQNFKKQEVRDQFGFYVSAWEEWESLLNDETKFRVAKEFILPKPNLIPLTDIIVYEKI